VWPLSTKIKFVINKRLQKRITSAENAKRMIKGHCGGVRTICIARPLIWW